MFTVKFTHERTHAEAVSTDADTDGGTRTTYEPARIVDTHTLWIADVAVVELHHPVEDLDALKRLCEQWQRSGSVLHEAVTYHELVDGDTGRTELAHGSRLITLQLANGEFQWWVASRAWLLGSDGQTIERIVP
ncbi:MAG TPA: hypothetical protein VIQ02_17995 [Jiangellaceae bacterium]